MKPVEVDNVEVMDIFVKSFLGQQKIGKTSFSAINAIFTYFIKKVETWRFSNMYDIYRHPS